MSADPSQLDPDLPAIACKRTIPTTGWTRPLFAWTRFADVQRSAVQFLAVGRGDRGVGFGCVTHRDKSEPTGFACHPVGHKGYFSDLTVLLEKILEIVFGRLKGEITYV
jgi:hypothetical protein